MQPRPVCRPCFEAAAGCQLSQRMAGQSETDASDGRTRRPVSLKWQCPGRQRLSGRRVDRRYGPCGSENKVPFVAAISLRAKGHQMHVKISPVHGFTRKAIATWARDDLSPGCVVLSDGLACCAG